MWTLRTGSTAQRSSRLPSTTTGSWIWIFTEGDTWASLGAGAAVLKPAKKGFFGGFTAVFQASDGSIWSPAAPTKKDTGRAQARPQPTEAGAILGVADPKASKVFYEALGLTVDRDYGDKFIDFTWPRGPAGPATRDISLIWTDSSGRSPRPDCATEDA